MNIYKRILNKKNIYIDLACSFINQSALLKKKKKSTS